MVGTLTAEAQRTRRSEEAWMKSEGRNKDRDQGQGSARRPVVATATLRPGPRCLLQTMPLRAGGRGGAIRSPHSGGMLILGGPADLFRAGFEVFGDDAVDEAVEVVERGGGERDETDRGALSEAIGLDVQVETISGRTATSDPNRLLICTASNLVGCLFVHFHHHCNCLSVRVK